MYKQEGQGTTEAASHRKVGKGGSPNSEEKQSGVGVRPERIWAA